MKICLKSPAFTSPPGSRPMLVRCRKLIWIGWMLRNGYSDGRNSSRMVSSPGCFSRKSKRNQRDSSASAGLATAIGRIGQRSTRFMCSNPIGAVGSAGSYSSIAVPSFSTVALREHAFGLSIRIVGQLQPTSDGADRLNRIVSRTTRSVASRSKKYLFLFSWINAHCAVRLTRCR